MTDSGSKRRAKRIEVSYEIKIRFPGSTDYVKIIVKDLSSSGARVVIPARLIKAGELLDMDMCVNDREIRCKGKVAWVLMLRPALGNIAVFDVGLEFNELKTEDQEFLDRLITR